MIAFVQTKFSCNGFWYANSVDNDRKHFLNGDDFMHFFSSYMKRHIHKIQAHYSRESYAYIMYLYIYMTSSCQLGCTQLSQIHYKVVNISRSARWLDVVPIMHQDGGPLTLEWKISCAGVRTANLWITHQGCFPWFESKKYKIWILDFEIFWA